MKFGLQSKTFILEARINIYIVNIRIIHSTLSASAPVSKNKTPSVILTCVLSGEGVPILLNRSSLLWL